MAKHFFTFTLDRSSRARKQIKQQRELSEILHVLDADESWVLFTVQPPDMSHDFQSRVTGRALRSRFESEMPGLVYAYEYFSHILGDQSAGLAKAKQWWLQNELLLREHYTFVTGTMSELGMTFEEQQLVIAQRVGLVSTEGRQTVDLPSDLDHN